MSNTTIALPEVLVHIGLLAVLFHLDLLSGLADLGLQLVNQGLEEQAQYVSTVCIYEYKKKIVKRSYLCQYTLGDYILCV